MGPDRRDTIQLPEGFEELGELGFEIIPPSGSEDAGNIFDEETYKILDEALERLGWDEDE